MNQPPHNDPAFDLALVDIVDYCFSTVDFPLSSLENARTALMDAMSCAFLSLRDTQCQNHLAPFTTNTNISNGVSVPGTQLQFDPVQAAYHITCMIRWLDYNDTWLAKEWGHPSDNLGAILACAHYFSQQTTHIPWSMEDILKAITMAYEIQGVLALENSFNELGFDHVILVRIASTAVAVKLLGGNRQQMLNALSNAFLDGAALRTYRHGKNTGARKSWAAADASSRGVWLAIQAINGEPGYATALSAETWGFNAVILGNKPLIRSQPYEHYVLDNILYKIAYPVEFHAQTAVECAIKLYAQMDTDTKTGVADINYIHLYTHKAAMKIINKTGPLNSPADRDHCIQYAVAVSLMTGQLSTENYHDEFSRNPAIDTLREKIQLIEDNQYTQDYYKPDKRAIANRIEIHFVNGQTRVQEVLFPLGHQRRRSEATPLLHKKFETAMKTVFAEERAQSLLDCYMDLDKFMQLTILDWMKLMSK